MDLFNSGVSNVQRDASLPANPIETERAVNGFNGAFIRKDVAGTMPATTDDWAFQSTSPAANRTGFQGQAAVRAVWEDFFNSSPNAEF